MGKREQLASLPIGALKEVADWLALTRPRFDDRRGWLKEDYVEELATAVRADEVAVLVDQIASSGDYHFHESVLVRLFGLPPKDAMLNRTKDELRAIMEDLETAGRAYVPWRSLSATELREYLKSKFSSEEIARIMGIAVPAQSKSMPPAPPSSPAAAITNETSPSATPLEITASGSIQTHQQIEDLDDLRRYLTTRFCTELEAIGDLGDNEQRFQHRIVHLLESRINLRNFSVAEKAHVPELDQYPDVLIEHGRGRVAFEIKHSGSVEGLLMDAEKLRGYLRARRTRITFGVLVYRSPLTSPDHLVRAMRSERLHLVRVNPRRRSG